MTILLVIWELTLKQLIIQLSLMKQFVYLFGQDQVCCLFYKVIYIYFKLCLDVEELLFECYQVPSVLFGVDSLFSLFYNQPDIQNCLVISLGHHTCHVIPYINQKMINDKVLRLNLGGFNLTCYLQRLLQLKYPKFTQEFTFTKCEYLVQNYCKVSSDYQNESLNWLDDQYYLENVKRFRTEKDFQSKSSVDIESQENFSNFCQRLLGKVTSNLTKKREKQVNLLSIFI